MSVARAALVVSALAVATALAGCKTDGSNSVVANAKSAQPLSPQLVSLMTEKGMSPSDPMLVRVFKEESKAEVWKRRRADGRYALLKTYDICRFSGKLGPKIKEGDKQAPEGFYSVGPAQMNPKSSYYLSFNIGFPNAYDRSLGRTGQHVMMHGDCLSAGCYAMTDDQMGEIYAMARESFRGGQKSFQFQALPFRMTAQNMARRRNDKNMAFWKNLKQGSDHFEVTKAEPKVDVCGRKYVFNATAGGLQSFNSDAGCPSYQVEPSIARAVAVKEKTDNILIAQLSKTEAIAPEYVAQNGRMRRTLDQPVVMVAAVAPEAAGTPVAATAVAGGGMALASVSGAPVKPGQAPAVVQPASAQRVALQTPVATDGSAPAPQASKAEGNLFARMFRSEEPEAASPIPAAPAAPTQVATAGAATAGAARPAPVPSPREVTPQQPVMATAASPAPAGAGEKLKSWVGGLFGQKPAESAAEPAAIVPASAPAPAAAPARRDRSAALPAEFQTKKPARPDQRVTSSFAAAE